MSKKEWLCAIAIIIVGEALLWVLTSNWESFFLNSILISIGFAFIIYWRRQP